MLALCSVAPLKGEHGLLTGTPGSPGGPGSPGKPMGPCRENGTPAWDWEEAPNLLRAGKAEAGTGTGTGISACRAIGGGMQGLGAAPHTSLCLISPLTRLPLAPSSPGGPFLPGGPAAPDCPASPFSPTSPFTPCRGTGWGVTLEQGRGSKMFTRSSACAFRDQREQDLPPPPLLLLPLKDTPVPFCDTHGWSRLPRGSGISRFARFTLGERKATGQMLLGAGWWWEALPTPSTQTEPHVPLPNAGLPFLLQHPAVPRHPAFPGGPTGKRMGVTHIGGSPCTRQPPPSPPGPYSPRHRWVPAAHGVLARRGGPVGSTEVGVRLQRRAEPCGSGGRGRCGEVEMGQEVEGERWARGFLTVGFPYHGANVSVLTLLARWAWHALRGAQVNTGVVWKTLG